ncbi:helix-turn-helix domain-containing protein [Sulfitobacter donghicola]|uniref:XRE family transcriptional regulator n=1 Tax=Sulfitobacter donghicola DSW-25 = KCTC 12864 = JCM 14565 TaxID=1300350 RepID=A0A073IHA9_9RHOB|nr:helix-turn-helix transcriptional regulator [Sulfitobacter donghicola]KEJ88935.1 XRE family transcriptional regulator [Sulfitobacter donghicola DSW-25 = KCTC 12864 = JCM 14565]KIN67519.1 putative helix-turn-helix protein [Sulfitobacter donghicola DSW-25 = KCTC 12864 = JCM 14565]
MDKRERADVFRIRLTEAMVRRAVSKSALARMASVDRSTIGQLLKDDLPRLPNAQLAADVADALGVSTDWLLGLTNRPETPGDIVAAAMSLSPAERISADEQLLEWHHEAAGYKVRHVPASLPDILKTERMLNWEYAAFEGKRLPEAFAAMQKQLAWLASGVSDYEIAIPVHEMEACATGTAYYSGVDKSVRAEQLNFIADQCDEMFPRLRIFLFDAHRVFSSPVTVFGPNLAVVYVGQCYLAFREVERVRSLTNHFDWLVREATVDARHVSSYIRSLID